MVDYYKKEYKLMLAVDCTIFGFDHEGLKILLIRRAFQPQKGKWSLVGGFTWHQVFRSQWAVHFPRYRRPA